MTGSLVAYKGKYAEVLSVSDNKFEIKIEGSTLKKVREKDFRFLSPTFSIPNKTLSPDFSALIDLEEELLSIEELSEWLFDEYSPNSSWQTFLLTEDGLYFFWQKDKIFIRPSSQVESITLKREEEHKEEELIARCIQNIGNNTFEKSDLPIIKEIEKVALDVVKSAKILKKINIENTPQKAHELLVRIGYFDLLYNPYPKRHQILPEEEVEITSPQQEVNTLDLTHINSYAIDNVGSIDADDAISVDDNTIWVHIADVIGFSGNSLLEYASHRTSNLYLPNEVINMLPKSITTHCALGMTDTSRALSIGFEYSADFKQLQNIQITPSIIKVTKTDYDSVDENPENFKEYFDIAERHKNYRLGNGSFSLDLPKVDVKLKDGEVQMRPQKNTAARLMIAEFMILAGRAVAQFSIENDIAMPFVSQEKGDFSEELLNKETLTLSESFASTRLFKKSIISNNALSHFGMGLDNYIRITSPLRRYLDLIAHFQLYSFIWGITPLTSEEIKESIMLNNAQLGSNSQVNRDSSNHYKLLYLTQYKDFTYSATVLRDMGEKKMIMLTDLSLISVIKSSAKLDEEISVKATHIDIFNQEFSVKEVL